MADQNSIKTIMTVDNRDVQEKLKQLESYYKSTYSGWIEATDKLKVKDQELISAKNSLAISTKALKEEQAKGTAANKDEIVILKQAVATHKDTVQVLNLEKSALTAVTAAHTKEMATSQQAMMLAKNLNKTKQELADTEIANARHRNDVLSSLSAQRTAEEKQRYLVLSSLAGQKTKEADADQQNIASMKAQYSRLYENTNAQNTYNDSVERLKAMRTQGVISQNQYVSALAKETDALKAGTPERDNQFNHMIRMLRWAGTLAGAYYALNTVWASTLGKGIELNRLYESQSLGLSAILASKTKMIDANGKEVHGVEKLNTAQTIMADTLAKIKEAATKTPATFSEMVGFYQQSIGHALTSGKSFGKNISEISDNTIKLTQRMSLLGGSIGMPMDRINEEIRSLMSGNASTDSLIASLLFGSPGAANKAIKEAKTRTDGLTKLFDGVLKDVDSLMGQNTFDMLKNNLVSTLETIQKASAKPLFDDIKVGFSDLDTYLSIHSVEISDTIETMYKQIKIGAGSLGSAVGEGVSVSVDFIGALVGIVFDSVDTMNDKYRKINLGDIMVLSVTTGIEVLRNLVDMAGIAIVEIGSMFNGLAKGITGTFEQINKGGAFMAGMFGSSKDAADFSKGADYWKRKTSDLNKDSKAFDQSASAILKQMSETDIRLAKAYNGLLLKDTSVTGGNKDANQKRLQAALTKLKPIEAEKAGKTSSEIAKEDREQLKAFELMKQKHDAELTYQQMLDVQKQSSFTLEESKLTDIQKLKLSNMRMELEGYGAVFAEASKISNEKNREKEIAILTEKYAKDSIAYGNEKLSIQKGITAAMDQQVAAADKLALKEFRRALDMQKLQSKRGRESDSFERTFGAGKISPETAALLSASARSEYVKGISNVTSEEVAASMLDSYTKRLEEIKNLIPEIPAIELNLKLNGWDDISNAIAGLGNSFTDLNKKTEVYNEYSKIAGNDTKKRAILDHNYAMDKVDAYGSMLGAARGFYKAESAEAKRLGEVQKALSMAKMVTQLGEMVQSSAFTALFVAQEEVKAVAAGTTAVAVAAQSSPWTGFATAAAMAAMLASMGIMLAGAMGSGKTSTSYDAFSAQAANTGTGSVLGDSSKASESITNSLKLMSDLAKPEFKLSSQMAASLASIDSKIGGLSANILRSAGFAVGEGFTASSSLGLGGQVGSTLTDLYKYATPTGLAATVIENLNIPIVSQLAGALNGFVGGAINSIARGIFGGGSSSSLADSGITFGNQSLSQATSNLQGNSYQTVVTHTDGGWFRGDRTSYDSYFSTLDEYTRSQFQLVLGNLRDITVQSATALDTSATTVKNNLSSYVVALGTISLNGKTGDEIKTVLTNILGRIGDELAATAFPALTQFQHIGEGIFETMTRVAGGMEEAAYYEGKISSSHIKYTEILNKQGDVATEALRQSIDMLDEAAYGASNGVIQIIDSLNNGAQDLFDTYVALDKMRFQVIATNHSVDSLTASMLYGAGGIDNLSTGLSDYIDGFLTDQEKLANQASDMNNQFTKIGVAMPANSAAFRQLVESIDTSTSSGQELYGRVILLSKGFNDLTTSVTSSLSSITGEAQNLSDAFTSMSSAIQTTIDKLSDTSGGGSQSSMIASFWDKRTQADILLAKRGDLTVKEQSTLQGLVTDLDSLALSIQGAQVGGTAGITSSLVGQLQGIQASVNLDNTIVKSLILDANGQTVEVATEGTLTRLTNAIANRNALLGIDGSHANGLDYVPYDGYVAQLHKGERVLTAGESASGYGARFNIMVNTSALEAINNKIYDRLSSVYNILNDAQLGSRPLYTRAI